MAGTGPISGWGAVGSVVMRALPGTLRPIALFLWVSNFESGVLSCPRSAISPPILEPIQLRASDFERYRTHYREPDSRRTRSRIEIPRTIERRVCTFPAQRTTSIFLLPRQTSGRQDPRKERRLLI